MKQTAWWQIDFKLLSRQPLETTEFLSNLLMDLGSSSVEEVIKRRRIQILRGYVPHTSSRVKILQRLKTACKQKQISPRSVKAQVRVFKDLSWQTKWKKFAKPLYLRAGGQELHIIPSHLAQTVKARASAPTIYMDAGMAFGTGSHPTTYLSLKTLLAEIPACRPKAMLDLGTGTGILAMAGFKLGVPRVEAIDIDPEATQVAGENFIKNNLLANEIALRTGSIDAASGHYDLIVANITLHPLLELLAGFRSLLNGGGKLILSGILTSQSAEMKRQLKNQKFRHLQQKNFRGWSCLLAEKMD